MTQVCTGNPNRPFAGNSKRRRRPITRLIPGMFGFVFLVRWMKSNGAIRMSSDDQLSVVHKFVMTWTKQHQIRQSRGTAVTPMHNVMTITP